MGCGILLWERMVWLLGGRVKRGVVVFFVSTTEVRTTRLFYIYGSWVRIRELEKIPKIYVNFQIAFSP